MRIVFVPKFIKDRISLPDGITEIPDYAFENCIGITEINIPSTVYYISESYKKKKKNMLAFCGL